METLIITGWGWKEYAVAAAVALKALKGRADVMGMSKRRLPEFIESDGKNWKSIVLIGMSLGGDEPRLAAALKALKKTDVVWISSLPMSESQTKSIAPLIRAVQSNDGLFNCALVKTVGRAFKVDTAEFEAYAVEGNKRPASVPRFHELVCAAMYAYRNYRDQTYFVKAIRYMSEGVGEESWSEDCRKIVEHYRRYGNRELIGKSVQMSTLRERINFVAANPDARVLVIGESGTGKETVALQIHNRSPRRSEPFIAFNCASVNPELLESRFFGHEKGAYTGADKQEIGLFELANGGTLFLDEIGELPLAAQGLLLRVLEGGRFMRMGGKDEISVDVRLVTATNRNLPRRVRDGKFREDLFMRLNVIQLRIPALREHRADIADIADNWWFNKFRKHLLGSQKTALMEYDYPGNVRELINIMERAVVFKEDDFAKLLREHREMNAGLCDDEQDGAKSCEVDDLNETLLKHVRRIYQKYGENMTRAAEALNVTRSTLRKYLATK